MELSSSAGLKPEKPLSRWPGVLLSLCVPGFGLLRAGQPFRALLWFFGLVIGVVPLFALIVADFFPVSASVAVLLAALALQVWMWYDSFRPGRMTGRLWVLFGGLFAAFIFMPNPIKWVARAFVVSSGAMQPTLKGSRDSASPDHVLADLLCYHFRAPKRGEVIVFTTKGIPGIPSSAETEETIFTMRVVGLPGESLEIRDGELLVDGVPQDERNGIPPIEYSNLRILPSYAERKGNAYQVGESEYFVLGDNSANSFDSRYWGTVPKANLLGKVTKIYYPFERIGVPRFEASSDR